jgi:hypothetical protein
LLVQRRARDLAASLVRDEISGTFKFTDECEEPLSHPFTLSSSLSFSLKDASAAPRTAIAVTVSASSSCRRSCWRRRRRASD